MMVLVLFIHEENHVSMKLTLGLGGERQSESGEKLVTLKAVLFRFHPEAAL